MPRFIILLSLIPIAIALVTRWWFGLKVLAAEGKRTCRCDLETWQPDPTDTASVQRSDASASNFGCQLRNKALATWKSEDPKAAAAREGAHRFGLAVPPLSGIVAIFALIIGKVPFSGAIAIFILATAIAAIFNLLSLPHELRAIARAAAKTKGNKCFHNSYDEEAVIRCAVAHAWELAVPPVLRLLQK
ncbi:MAG: hypothetical protein Q7R22_014585 [Verrucomicrobiota bacterium JB025]|nr:hypothetical protein [Verrucomicrobiota bacterium JB025]